MVDDGYTTQEGFWLSKPILLPDARSFSDVLEYLGEWDQFKTEGGRFEGNPPDGRIIGEEQGNRRRGNEVGPFCTFRNFDHHRSIAVRATDAVIDAVTPRIVTPDDSLRFEIIYHKDRDRALVTLHHSYIIGSHWLAYIDPSTIPAYPYTLRDERYSGICDAIKESGETPFVKRLPGGEIEISAFTRRGMEDGPKRIVATVHSDGSITRVWADGTVSNEPAGCLP